MLINSAKVNGVTASGTFSGNTQQLRGMCHHVICHPTNGNTTYDINIVNPTNIKIFERTSQTGIFSELLEMPVFGKYTVTVINSTADEAFIIQLVIVE